MDNVLFSMLTMNPQPLHSNEDFAAKTPFGQRIVNGIFVLGLVTGLSVADLTEGTILANVGYDKVISPNPTFHGDTIYAETEVLEKRDPNPGLAIGSCAAQTLGQETGWHGGHRIRAHSPVPQTPGVTHSSFCILHSAFLTLPSPCVPDAPSSTCPAMTGAKSKKRPR